MVLRRVRRYLAMLRAVDKEMTKVSSGGVMRNEGVSLRSQKRVRVTDGPERKQDRRARYNRVREVRYLWRTCHLRINVQRQQSVCRWSVVCTLAFLDRYPVAVMNQTYK